MNTKSTKHTLIKGKDVIGLKVVALQKGQEIDDVGELVYDPRDRQVKALVVDSGGWFADAKVILFGDIKTIGKDAVIVESAAVIKKASEVTERIARIVKDDNYLTENEVMTEDGVELGHVSDIYFEPETGKVVELEVSQGALKNVQSGKKRVQVTDITKVGEDVTIVKGYVEERLEKQAQRQGVQGAVDTAQKKAPDVLDQAKQKLTEFGETARKKTQELTDQTKQKVQDVRDDPRTLQRMDELKSKAIQAKDTAQQKTQEGKEKFDERNKKDALGKYVTVNVLSIKDELLAKRGDMVTNKLLEQAEKNGMLEQILNNVSSEPLSHSSDLSSGDVEVDLKVRKQEQSHKKSSTGKVTHTKKSDPKGR